MKNRNIMIIIVLAIALIGGLYYYTSRDNGKIVETPQVETPEKPVEPVVKDIAVGQLAPDFTLKNLAGEEVSLSDYRGKIVMINFWASWCKYCDIEMPDIQKISKENDDLVVLGVNVMEDDKTVKDYLEKGGYDFPVVLDKDGKISQTYLVSGLPNSYFIDKEGILLGRIPSMLTYPQMNEILESIRDNE